MSLQDILHMYYIEADNLFVDDDGYIIYNLFDYITPNDLFLFKYDNAHNLFPMANNLDALVQLIPISDEMLSCFDEIWDDIDVGDDYERVGRYERARANGCFC